MTKEEKEALVQEVIKLLKGKPYRDASMAVHEALREIEKSFVV